jgi:hypothetical protein
VEEMIQDTAGVDLEEAGVEMSIRKVEAEMSIHMAEVEEVNKRKAEVEEVSIRKAEVEEVSIRKAEVEEKSIRKAEVEEMVMVVVVVEGKLER